MVTNKRIFRWLFIVPSVVASFMSVVGIYWLLHQLLLKVCPRSQQSIDATTDLSRSDFSTTTPGCTASWYPTVEAIVLMASLFLAVILCGVVAHRLAPAHKRLAGVLSAAVVCALLAAAFLWPETY